MNLLLDTHVAIWLATADENLGKRSRTLIEVAVREATVAISAISFWEIGLLIEKGRLKISLPAEELRRRLLQSGVAEVALTGEIALLSIQLALHGDPADRFIAATAAVEGATLVTADDRLLDWKHAVKRQNARR
jgi:PIN domain nuclease of toxin-antitoxin system